MCLLIGFKNLLMVNKRIELFYNCRSVSEWPAHVSKWLFPVRERGIENGESRLIKLR